MDWLFGVWMLRVIIRGSSYKYIQTMEQKVLLINSMQKLINHIVVSKKNQEEIFASLSKNDFKKIISNLEDDNQKLRKISLLLISQLLYNNQALKEKFCNIMNIPTVPGRVALNTKLCPSSSRTKNTVTVDMSKNIKEVYTLLKQPVLDNEKQSLFWYINFESNKQGSLQLDFLSASHPQSVQIADLLDPIDSMVGFVLCEKLAPRKIESQVQSPLVENRRKSQYEASTSNRLVNNYFKPTGYKQQSFKANQQAVLNQSLNLNPGYSTDREMGYIPKHIHAGVKAVNTTLQHDSPYSQFHKSIQNGTSPPLHQIKNSTLQTDIQNRSKYGGIKLISTATTVARGREGTKYFEENPLFHGSITSTNKNVGSANGGSNAVKSGLGRAERGYETLREKKIIEKYPVE